MQVVSLLLYVYWNCKSSVASALNRSIDAWFWGSAAYFERVKSVLKLRYSRGSGERDRASHIYVLHVFRTCFLHCFSGPYASTMEMARSKTPLATPQPLLTYLFCLLSPALIRIFGHLR